MKNCKIISITEGCRFNDGEALMRILFLNDSNVNM